jgi:hypothetical protein
MIWSRPKTTVHRRGDVLRQVVKVVDRRQVGVLPMDHDGVSETFRDELDLVGALQLRWHALLAGNIERALSQEPGDTGSVLEDIDTDLAHVVLTAWYDARAELPGVRLVLDTYAKNPTSPEMAEALDIANRKDWAVVAVMAGMASAQDADAAEVGRTLDARVRSASFEPLVRVEHQLSLRERLKLAWVA